jgi:hypothetical protein
MKVLKKKYPKGTWKYQKSDGRYIDKLFYNNLKFLAKKIVNDMTFLSVCFSSTLEVGTGKSVFSTQVGEIWTAMVNKIHGTNLTFDEKNVVFRPKELIDRSFELPKYSCIVLDEWEDAHYFSELGTTLRTYFRKCRQQNLFIIIIIPNYFQLNMNYAIGRSIFAVDVKFDDNLDRGNYSFYDFGAKKDLYIKGKKFHNYKVTKPTFKGWFGDGYGLDQKKYLDAKKADFERWDGEDKNKPLRADQVMKLTQVKTARTFYDNKEIFQEKGINYKTIAQVFKISQRQAQRWLQKELKLEKMEQGKIVDLHIAPDYTIKEVPLVKSGNKMIPLPILTH